MSKAILANMAGTRVGETELSETVFRIEPNQTVIHEVVKNHLVNCQQGTQNALTRTEVSGGDTKPWHRRGIGHVRQGGTRTPQWTHGGIVLALRSRDYSYVLNKKVKHLALRSAPSAKVVSDDIVVVDSLSLDEVKTKVMKDFLNTVGAKKAVVVTPEANKTVIKSARNVPGAVITVVKILSVYDIVNAGKPIVDKAALATIEEVFA